VIVAGRSDRRGGRATDRELVGWMFTNVGEPLQSGSAISRIILPRRPENWLRDSAPKKCDGVGQLADATAHERLP